MWRCRRKCGSEERVVGHLRPGRVQTRTQRPYFPSPRPLATVAHQEYPQLMQQFPTVVRCPPIRRIPPEPPIRRIPPEPPIRFEVWQRPEWRTVVCPLQWASHPLLYERPLYPHTGDMISIMHGHRYRDELPDDWWVRQYALQPCCMRDSEQWYERASVLQWEDVMRLLLLPEWWDNDEHVASLYPVACN